MGCLVQVHYNRVAEDGISSHKEITVMFLPNLSDSIPIMEVGQAQSSEQQQAKLEHDIADKNEKVCTIKEASLFHDQLVEREVKSHNVVFVSQTCVVSFLCYKIHFSEWARSACILLGMGLLPLRVHVTVFKGGVSLIIWLTAQRASTTRNLQQQKS
jgi:hypothetical protein